MDEDVFDRYREREEHTMQLADEQMQTEATLDQEEENHESGA